LIHHVQQWVALDGLAARVRGNHTHVVQPEHQLTRKQETSIDKVSCVLHLISTSMRLNEK
jgi:hypothetical protein